MFVKVRLLTFMMTAGLLPAALFGCAAAEKAQPGAAKPRPVPTTVVGASEAMWATVGAATSVHVTGIYIWPHSKLKVNVGLRMPDQMAGSLVSNGLPMSMIVTGGKMYVKVTSAFLAHLGKLGECKLLCGNYVIAVPATAASYLRSIGGTTTVAVLQGMASPTSSLSAITYHGRPAFRWVPAGYAHGAYIIVSRTPECYPLEARDPGHFVLTFSQWNRVPAPAPPPKSKTFTGTW